MRESFSDQAARLARVRVGSELVSVKAGCEGFVKTLFTQPYSLTYVSGESYTDTKGMIVLDGDVAENEELTIGERVDILEGVLLDEVGHNLYPPVTRDQAQDAWYGSLTGDEHWSRPVLGGKLFPSLHNLVEDIHNVWQITGRFTGFRVLHAVATEYYMGDLAQRIARYEVEAEMGRPSVEATMNALIAASKAEYECGEPGLEALRKMVMRAGQRFMAPYERVQLAIEVTNTMLDMLMDPDDDSEPPESEGGESPQQSDGKGEGFGTQGSSQAPPSDDEAEGDNGSGSDKDEGEDESQDEDEADGSGLDEDQDDDGDDGQGSGEDEDEALFGLTDEERLVQQLQEEIENLPELTQNAGMKVKPGSVSEVPEEDVDENPETVQVSEYNGEYDVHVTHNPRFEGQPQQTKLHPQAKQIANMLGRQTRFQAATRTSRVSGYRRGSLAKRDVVKIATGRVNAFSRKTRKEAPHVNLMVVVDRSQSMDSMDRWQAAVQLLDILDRAYGQETGVTFKAIDYTCKPYDESEIRIAVLRGEGTKPDLTRTTAYTGGMTPTVPAMDIAYDMYPPSGERVMVLITDGDPNAGGGNEEVHAWMQAHRDVRLVQVVLGWSNGAEIPATYRVHDNEGLKRVTRLARLISTAVGRAMG